METQQLLRDAEIAPTADIIAAGLGPAYSAYEKLIESLESRDVQVDWRYYKDSKAWLGKGLYKWTTSRGTQKEMTALWLSIWEGLFKVNVMFPERVRADVMALPLTDEVREMVASSSQIGK